MINTLSLTEIREKLTMIRRVCKMRVSGMFIVGCDRN
jgi:hypothetical protein